MKMLFLSLFVTFSPLPAQATYAGELVEGSLLEDGGVPVVTLPDGGTIALPGTISVDDPVGTFKSLIVAIRTGQGWIAAMLVLFLLVGFFRVFGRKLHDMIPDDNLFDKPFYFVFETKIGGWLLNWLTTIALSLGASQAAGIPVDATTWRVAIMASFGGTVLIELKDDVVEWWKKRKAASTPATPVKSP